MHGKTRKVGFGIRIISPGRRQAVSLSGCWWKRITTDC